MKFKKTLLFILPSIIFIIPALLGLSLVVYNRIYRGISTPYLIPSLGLILIALFFLAKKPWMYWALGLATLAFIGVFLNFELWRVPDAPPTAYYYKAWKFNTKTGRIKLIHPLGFYPPASGSYVACSFALKSWLDYFDNQPILCTAFDDQLRILMFLNDHDTDEGTLREFQLNSFKVERKSLLGDPLDRSALRIAFIPLRNGLWPQFKIKKIYEVFEKEVEPGRTRVIESFSRKPSGALESLTESSLLNLTVKDLYAVYDQNGILVKIPRMNGRSFVFPAKIEVSRLAQYPLPPFIQPRGDHIEN